MNSNYKYTDTELKILLKSLIILVDTREQTNDHIIKHFEVKKIPYISKKLDYGDYSVILPAHPELGIMRDIYFDCVIERKNSLEELSSNLSSERDRFESELLRAKGSRFILMVEESQGYEKIITHKYNTQYNEKSFLATLFAFGHRYGMDINFITKQYAGFFIHQQLLYYVREFLTR